MSPPATLHTAHHLHCTKRATCPLTKLITLGPLMPLQRVLSCTSKTHLHIQKCILIISRQLRILVFPVPDTRFVRRPSSVRLCLRPPAVGFSRLSCVWPAGGCAPPVIFKKNHTPHRAAHRPTPLTHTKQRQLLTHRPTPAYRAPPPTLHTAHATPPAL